MSGHAWVKEFPGIILVCDAQGTLLEMNDRAERAFAAQGGAALLGRSVLGCHSPEVGNRIREMLENGRRNVYFSESGGARKLIYQVPWTENGAYRGIVEICLDMEPVERHEGADGS